MREKRRTAWLLFKVRNEAQLEREKQIQGHLVPFDLYMCPLE